MTSSSKTPAVGIVYFIRSRQTGLHKIGMTGDWSRRSKQLLVGEKADEIIHVNTFNPRSVEQALHERFKAVRLPQSEWFRLTDAEVQEVVGTLQSVQRAFNTKQEDPRLKLMVLQQRIEKARNAAERDIHQFTLRQHMEKHFPEELRQQEDAAIAADIARSKAKRAMRLEQWNNKPLLDQVLSEWFQIIVVGALASPIPVLLLSIAAYNVRKAECANTSDVLTCQARLQGQALADGFKAAGVGVGVTMAWSAMRLKRKKQAFLEGRQ